MASAHQMASTPTATKQAATGTRPWRQDDFLAVAVAQTGRGQGDWRLVLARHSIGQGLLAGGLGWAAWERPRWSRSVLGTLGGLRGVLTPAR